MATLRLSSPPPPRVAKLLAAIAPVAKPEPEPAPPTKAKGPAHTPPVRYDQRSADLTMLRERFPAVFNLEAPVPLALGVDRELRLLLARKRAGRVLSWWCGHPAYRAAVARGGPRYNLDGSVAGEVTEQQQTFAVLNPRSRGRYVTASPPSE